MKTKSTAQGKVNAVTTLDKKNVVHADNNQQAAKRAAAAKEGIATQQSIAEQGLASERATADASMSIHHASIEARLASDLAFAAKDKQIKEAANQADIAALDKSGKEYGTQLKALQDNALKITAEYNAKVTEMKSKASVTEYNRDISQMEQAEAAKIGAVKEGTAARLAVIDAAIKEEEAKGLAATQHFHELMKQREQEVRKEADVEAKAQADATDNQVKALRDAARAKVEAANQTVANQHGNDGGGAKRIAMARQEADADYAIKKEALQKELDAYKQAGQERAKDAERVSNQVKQLNLDYANTTAQLNTEQANANKQMYATEANDAAQSLLQVALGHKSLAATVQQYAMQGAEAVLEGLLMQIAGNATAKMSAAEAAAASAGNSVAGIPIVGAALAPVAAASVFAALMAFEVGGVVPGVGKGDVVPAMLTPGEGVVPGGVMDGLRNVARNGGFHGGGTTNHYHSNPTYHVSVLDGDGMKTVLEKNEDVVHQHFTNAVRRTNS